MAQVVFDAHRATLSFAHAALAIQIACRLSGKEQL
jgi:hypothetical protein